MEENISNIIVYNDGELELNVSVGNETIWLTQKQLGELFNVEIHTINYHIKNIYKQKELMQNPTTRKIRIVQKEGNRTVERDVEHYNLDMIISIGYRVNSITATKFRQWATSVLINYIQNGYVINGEKITNDRFISLENEVINLKSKVENISNSLENKTLKEKQGIFYDGQIFDAYALINELLKSVITETVFTLFSKYPNIKVKIYTANISKQLKLDFEKYNKQYKNIEIKEFKNSHDRFLILDKKELFHLGASLKDLGKKWFAFSKFEIDNFNILEKLK